jgi:hypothetical protein
VPKFSILKKNTDLHTCTEDPTEDVNLQIHIFFVNPKPFATIEQHKGEVCVEDTAPTHLG